MYLRVYLYIWGVGKILYVVIIIIIIIHIIIINRNLYRKVGVLAIQIVKSNVASVGLSLERKMK